MRMTIVTGLLTAILTSGVAPAAADETPPNPVRGQWYTFLADRWHSD